jgi:hypothetical protein
MSTAQQHSSRPDDRVRELTKPAGTLFRRPPATFAADVRHSDAPEAAGADRHDALEQVLAVVGA